MNKGNIIVSTYRLKTIVVILNTMVPFLFGMPCLVHLELEPSKNVIDYMQYIDEMFKLPQNIREEVFWIYLILWVKIYELSLMSWVLESYIIEVYLWSFIDFRATTRIWRT